MTTGLVPAA